MPKPATDLFQAHQHRYVRLERTSKRLAQLRADRSINEFDVEQICSGIYLDAFVSLERFIEDLFIGYVSGIIFSPSNAVKPFVKIAPTNKARDVLMGGRSYLDWLPYDTTKKRADIYFKAGSTFSSLTPREERLLIELHRIRNALAHRSTHSLDVFQRLVIAGLPLPPRDKRPARFLLSTFRAHPAQTRLQNYLVEMLAISQRLSA